MLKLTISIIAAICLAMPDRTDTAKAEINIVETKTTNTFFFILIDDHLSVVTYTLDR